MFINLVEHPSRMALSDTKSCHQEWMQSFNRASVLQSRLALVCVVSGASAYYCNPKQGLPFLLAGGLIGSLIPYTIFILKPNSIDPIYDEEITLKKSESFVRETIDKWNTYHMVRSLVSFPAFVGCVVYLVSGKTFW